MHDFFRRCVDGKDFDDLALERTRVEQTRDSSLGAGFTFDSTVGALSIAIADFIASIETSDFR